MLKIRLQRVGRIHEPRFRVVLTDSKNSTKSGRFKEVLGSYDARKSEDNLKGDRIKHWLSLGASPTATVHNLLVKHKVIDAPKVNLKVPLKAPVAKTAEPTTDPSTELGASNLQPTAEETPVEETPAESAPATETPEVAPEAETPADTAPTSAEGEVGVPTENVGKEKSAE